MLGSGSPVQWCGSESLSLKGGELGGDGTKVGGRGKVGRD